MLLRVSFGDNPESLQEIRAWLTRRMVKILWADIMHAMEVQVLLDNPEAANARADIVSMKHQDTVNKSRSRGDYDLPFSPKITGFPLGEQPVLLTQAPIYVVAKQTPRINFITSAKTSFELAFTPAMLHGLCTLLQDTVKLAAWHIELNLPGLPAEEMNENRILN